MKKLQSILCLLLAAAMLLSLAACGQKAETEEAAPAEPEVPAPAEPDVPAPDGAADPAAAVTGQGGLDGFAAQSLPILFADLGGENRVYSPLNIYMALSMLAEVTDGATRAELLALLGCDSLEELRAEVGRLWEATYRDDEFLVTLPAASLWMRDDMDYKAAALEALEAWYHSAGFSGTMGSEDYDKQLHDWINEQTKELLKEQADGLKLDPETVIALVTTLYFSGRWTSEFQESMTEKDVFHKDGGDVETDFMHRKGLMAYYRGEHFSAICLPMIGGAGMWLLLPDEGYTLQALIDSGEAMAFLQAQSEWEDSKQARVSISLPRFDICADFSLIGALKALGLEAVFDADLSDFSPLTDEEGLSVTQAEHAARVKIDEEGCEAAAYTAIAVAGAAVFAPEPEEIDFVCDHPFLFAVTGSEGQILFLGAVNDPAE